MLGFHRRTRSLIPVKELAKYDILPLAEEQAELEEDVVVQVPSDITAKVRYKQLALVYMVFLAEAYVTLHHL